MANHTLNALALPGDMMWTDEFNWSPVERSIDYSLTGALIVDIGTRQAGRTITLEGADDAGWLPRSTLQALYALAANAGLALTLTLADGRVFDVSFADGQPIDAHPVVPFSDPTGESWYVVTLKLIEV